MKMEKNERILYLAENLNVPVAEARTMAGRMARLDDGAFRASADFLAEARKQGPRPAAPPRVPDQAKLQAAVAGYLEDALGVPGEADE
jgi:hypothetical protein